jgi:quercetin dioxygenase-like cupin family protein
VRQQKIWGTTEAILRNPFVQVHEIRVQAGGYCSIHKHDARYNMFIVVSGALEVSKHSADGDLLRADTYFGGTRVSVAPGVVHSFRALTDVHAFEVYWPEEVRDSDIDRLTEGGLHPQGVPV